MSRERGKASVRRVKTARSRVASDLGVVPLGPESRPKLNPNSLINHGNQEIDLDLSVSQTDS
jgi:hypothetical protein